jgi:CHAT domain-containing protein/ATP/maltotriose-dependent transcriptional regulator MalT
MILRPFRRAETVAGGRRQPPRAAAALTHLARLALLAALAGARFPEAAPASGLATGAAPGGGVVLIGVTPGSTLARAGVLPGDLVRHWAAGGGPQVPPASGEIATVFDWSWLVTEQAPRGEIRLTVERRGRRLELAVHRGDWGARVLPRLPAAQAAAARRCLELEERSPASARQAVAARWAALADSPPAAGSPGVRGWLLLQASRDWTAAGQPVPARAAAGQALRLARGPRAEVAVARGLAEALVDRSDWSQAAAMAASEPRIAAAAWGESLELAQAELDLGAVALAQGKTDLAVESWQRCLALRERLAPGSADLATVLGRLAGTALSRDDLDAAERLASRALDMLQRQDAPDLETLPLMILGSVARERGDPDLAVRLLGRALERHSATAPDLMTAEILNRLGTVARRRGDLAEAQRRYGQALAIWDRLAPESLARTNVLMNLGWVASDRGDLAAARKWMEPAVAARERLQPGSLSLASSLDQLGIVVEDQGDFDLAESIFRRGLVILERLAPVSMRAALAMGNLGELALRRGAPDRAVELCTRALAVQERLAPRSPMPAGNLATLAEAQLARHDLAAAWSAANRAAKLVEGKGEGDACSLRASLFAVLGEVARQRGELDRAASFFRRALAIQEPQGYGGYEVADTLHALGQSVRRRQPAAAAGYFDQALALLEEQVRRLGGSRDLQAAYRARHQAYYRDAIALAVDRRLAGQALALLERSRGQGLLAQLAERDLAFAGDVPPALRHEERGIAADIDRAEIRRLQLARMGNGDELALLQGRLAELHRRHDESVARIRQACPRYAALEYPVPLDPEGVRRALDPGTVMLSYSLGERTSYLFVVSADGPLEVRRLPAGEAELRRRVTELRNLIGETRGGSLLGRDRRRTLERTARELYGLLLRPAAGRIALGRRLLVVPDGVLNLLPWGALIRDPPGKPGRGWEYVAQWRPIHVAVSATVYNDLRRLRTRDRPGGGIVPAGDVLLAAFADPQVPAWLSAPVPVPVADLGLRSAIERGSSFEPLPYSRLEVAGIAGLFSGGARTYLGAAATEERAKAVGRQVRYLHFATHTTLDEQSPLDSAVVLAIPERLVRGRENGLLQAWEIFDSVRLDADLVVLSGCESALGKEMDGEGLLGLTRAFQYAGAQAVVASLWKVSDRMTAPLMVSFYRALRAGLPKDEALRQAQLELLQGGEASRLAAGAAGGAGGDGGAGGADGAHQLAPFFWAGFEVFGDWR